MSPRSAARQLAALEALHTLFGGMKLAMRLELQGAEAEGPAPMLLRMLQLCQQHPGTTQQGLVQLSGRDKGQVARMVKELLDQGLLTRQPHPEDRRSHLLQPSTAGLAACARFEQAQAGAAARLFGHLGAAELDALARQWQALGQRMQPPHDDAA